MHLFNNCFCPFKSTPHNLTKYKCFLMVTFVVWQAIWNALYRAVWGLGFVTETGMPPQSHHRDSGTTYFLTLCNLIWWVLNVLEWRVLIGCSQTHTTGILWDILSSSRIPDFWFPLSGILKRSICTYNALGFPLLVCLTNAWKRTEETEGDLLPL